MHLPVTALHTVRLNEQLIILAGQGPFLRLYDGRTHQLLSSTRIFDVQPIHHIEHQHASNGLIVVAVGGRLATSLAIESSRDGAFSVRQGAAHAIDAKEWVLSVRAHDAAFIFLTTNNALFRLPLDHAEDESPAVGELVQGPGSTLYSGDVCAIHDGKLLVAAGSVFGEVLVWTCQPGPEGRWLSQTTHRFEGHTGSIFGVCLWLGDPYNGRPGRAFVASCSDDRTVQVWDITDYDDPAATAHREEAANTGFGQDVSDSRHRLAMGWGHQSRIWAVDILDVVFAADCEHPLQLRLLTRGEDGTCQDWTAQLSQEEAGRAQSAKMLPTASDRLHAGKNVWAWARVWQGVHYELISGGADGRVVSRDVSKTGAHLPGVVRCIEPFKQSSLPPPSQSLKEYAIIAGSVGHEILALTGNGEIVKSYPHTDHRCDWVMATSASDFQVTRICGNAPAGLIIAATTKGILIKAQDGEESTIEPDTLSGQNVAFIQVAGAVIDASAHRLRLCLLVAFMSGKACAVWFDQEQQHTEAATQWLRLPDHFAVTSSCYDHTMDVLVLGSRAGAVAVLSSFQEADAASCEAVCFRHVHGRDAVTSLQFLPVEAGKDDRYILSTGRDGRCGIHRLRTTPQSDNTGLQTIHWSSPPFGPYVEGATVVASPGTGARELILYGFRSKDFIAWNQTKQLDVVSIDCGGAHRSWAYRHGASTGQGGGSFVWTKASTYNLHSDASVRQQVIQTGGHGREIKALAVCPQTFSSVEHGVEHAPLFATGAEDTAIRIFAVRQTSAESELVQMCMMDDHTAGLQALVFSRCGKFLFSSGGAEQLYAWSLSYDVPIVGVGSVLRNRMPQTDEDSDVRIMSLSVHEDALSEAPMFHVAAAYSNGKVKLLRYIPGATPGDGTWRMDREMHFGSFCLMQVFQLHDPGAAENCGSILSAGTNGFVNLTALDQDAPRDHQMKVHGVHQSSVLAMDVSDLGAGNYFIASGGDDNALGLTMLTIPTDSAKASRVSDAHFTTSRVRDAHAAALTALKVLSEVRDGANRLLWVATAGNDQRVIVWKVTVPMNSNFAPGSLQIVKVLERWTAVADVSGLDVVGTRLVVTGVGIEVLDLEDGVHWRNRPS